MCGFIIKPSMCKHINHINRVHKTNATAGVIQYFPRLNASQIMLPMQENDAASTAWRCSGYPEHPSGAHGPPEQVAVEETGARHEVHQHQQAERRPQQAAAGARTVCRSIALTSFLLSSLAPNPKTKNQKLRGLGLTLKSYGKDMEYSTMFSANIINLTCCIIIKMPEFRVDNFSAGRTKWRSPMLKRTWWNSLALFQIVNL